MSSMSLQWYEIGVLDYSKRHNVASYNGVFLNTGRDLPFNSYGMEAGWRYRKVDRKEKVPVRVIFRQARGADRAKKIAQRIGTVIFCHKVDTSYHYKKIEHLNLKQVPPTVTIAREDEFVLNSSGELTPTLKATRMELERKYEIEIDY